MKHLISIFLLFLSFSVFSDENPTVLMETSQGPIIIELYPTLAPKTVDNFLKYVQTDGFKQTTFHRIINNFMIQGGGFEVSGKKAVTFAAIENESRNGLSNKRGTIAMARTNNPHSATRQFFINHNDNHFLDAQDERWGYSVFGKVIKGMEVVDKIAMVKTGAGDKPIQTVIINRISAGKK
ncbi:peptidyl-prolyl cis-trans isomerase, cyclophilin type [Psychromonas ingrahamii 37]|uniref:Peptidyl-prolyl cis-trans isomerase n=1 Tax=Psychromonas ingrahamii (strain DSM 17664 / CCUG 51855 / 37) TaxID=357804 RepID=A1STV4_PSYIN|nr:peptidylprolyl isomerase [Psychromonas ingrahamii]ABM02919.1 peptidyl-prolyl cis-trans isomerase, cyclophilin type [Psychromonas ingrahamii 37]